MESTALPKFCCLLLLMAAGIAHADKLAEAKQHYLNGAKAYEEGDFQRAVDEYRASYDLSRRPLLLYDLGQAYRKLGNHELSLHSYQQFLARSTEGRDAEYRDSAAAQVKQLEALIEEQRKVKAAPPAGVTSPESEKPPAAAPAPPQVAAPAISIVAAPPPERPQPPPARKRAWVWGVVGGVVAAGVALGVGLGVGLQSNPPKPVDGMVTF